MTPERIWTTGTDDSGSWNAAKTSLGRYAPETEYVRADLFAALTAEVEALRKRESDAREIARHVKGNCPCCKGTGLFRDLMTIVMYPGKVTENTPIATDCAWCAPARAYLAGAA